MITQYKTIEKEYEASIKEKGSTFTAYLFPAPDEFHFKRKLEELRTQLHDATHHCYAFRIDPEGILNRSSDDGEPSGTAGKPIMGQLINSELSYVGLVVVRYYGGVKLGTGGLIKAYREAAKEVLSLAEIIEKEVTAPYQITFPYEKSGIITRLLDEFHIEVTHREAEEKAIWNIEIGIERIEPFKENLKVIGGIKIIHRPL